MKLEKTAKKYMKTVLITFPLLAVSSCGAWQNVKDGTVETSRSIFYAKQKVLKLDLIANNGLNQNERGQSLSTVVRIYQLKNSKNFEVASYQDLLKQDNNLLSGDLLESKQLIIRPGETVGVYEKYHKDASYIGIVAFFSRADDEQSWKLLIPKKLLSNSKPLPVDLVNKTIRLQGQVQTQNKNQEDSEY
ncbi:MULTISPECIES: type VI secretion system lipoprotein TssJ [unclassified Neisseria]|uniref:type VI secretion system lipoprotein TssJ n=1 Tax=unclassified Neisseria TaxID=2623750 RepID=UPI002664F744|nr:MULTISPECIES: type VI secretion system lipoprotein TssJ [unclassified Neisseria]MDO1509203.1 type VI secretion system lipoprotein TssJ [Neisseria sp. MVDL19-042950]MDO1515518.1 type VI secretion system lipoprotein TssJ [Neisseria sp. MVDL18-041461]MDO1562877.1 type VI secretion system lipoprotein TssJ [Neisseria sp. MVDL20-010259]